MQDADLFIGLAGIAGVFVGFGALIAVRNGGATGRVEVGYTRGMVGFGVLAVVAALAPVTFGRYDLTEHQAWALSSALVLVGYVVFIAVQVWTPEYRANMAAEWEAPRPRWAAVVDAVATGLYMTVGVMIPISILLGLAPDLEAALYFTLVVLILLGAAWLLLGLVYAQHEPATEAPSRRAPTGSADGSPE
jgi:hypothetical protein